MDTPENLPNESEPRVTRSSSVPKWASDYNLQLCGCYYEGFVDNYDLVLSQHCMESVTTYGVRKSRKKAASTEDKENETEASYRCCFCNNHRN